MHNHSSRIRQSGFDRSYSANFLSDEAESLNALAFSQQQGVSEFLVTEGECWDCRNRFRAEHLPHAFLLGNQTCERGCCCWDRRHRGIRETMEHKQSLPW